MKNIIKYTIFPFGTIVNLFLFIVSTTEFVEKESAFFFLWLILGTIFISSLLYCNSYSGYTEKPPLNFFYFLFKATYYLNLFLLIGIFLYFLTDNGDWITFFSSCVSIFILSDLFQCLTEDKFSRKTSFLIALIFALIKINENSEIFLGSFGIYYFYTAVNDSDSFNLVEGKNKQIGSNIKLLKEKIYPFRANVGLFLFAFTLSIPLTSALTDIILFIHSLNIIPILRSLVIVKERYPIPFENLLFLMVTTLVYVIIIILLTRERKISKTKMVLNKIKNGEE